jgi:hypothetical protein
MLLCFSGSGLVGFGVVRSTRCMASFARSMAGSVESEVPSLLVDAIVWLAQVSGTLPVLPGWWSAFVL